MSVPGWRGLCPEGRGVLCPGRVSVQEGSRSGGLCPEGGLPNPTQWTDLPLRSVNIDSDAFD